MCIPNPNPVAAQRWRTRRRGPQTGRAGRAGRRRAAKRLFRYAHCMQRGALATEIVRSGTATRLDPSPRSRLQPGSPPSPACHISSPGTPAFLTTLSRLLGLVKNRNFEVELRHSAPPKFRVSNGSEDKMAVFKGCMHYTMHGRNIRLG